MLTGHPSLCPILCSYRDSFAMSPEVMWLPAGLTLAEAAERFRALPRDFAARGTICLNGAPVPRATWHLIRPKAPAPGRPVELTFHQPPLGGGDTGKKALGLVASIGLSLTGGWIVGGGLAKGLGLTAFRAGSGLAYAAAAGVQIVGSLLISALIPPQVAAKSAKFRNPGAASAQGNTLDPNGPVPRVIGTRKIFPPLALEPLTYFEGPDEIVEACYALAGPHKLSDIRIGAAAAEGLAGCILETRAGWPGDAPLTLLTRQSRTEAVQTEVSGHSVDGDDGSRLDPTLDPSVAVPQPVVVATRAAPHEHQLQLIFAQGLHYQGSESVRMRVPLRLRLRRRETMNWRNLPELHFQAASLRQLRVTIRLIWTDATATPAAAGAEGWVEARRSSPDQTAAPAGGGWTADPAFGSTGDAWMAASNTGTTGVVGVELTRYEARIHLDPALWEPGRWEVEITRGVAFAASDYASAGYTVDGSVWALMGYRNPAAPTIARSRDGIADTLQLLRSVSIWNEAPVVSGDVALIALRARNRALDAVSVVASGWVQDWDGTEWREWRVTSNPAPHLRDILAGRLNADALPAEALDDAGLVDFRGDCLARGYEVNAVIEGQSVAEAARITAACGYASVLQSDLWGVAMDRDRSGEAPVQIFTPRNSSGFAWRRAMPRLPDGLRVTFRDADYDYDQRQITVLRPGGRAGGLFEQVEYEGLVTEAEVRARACYDLAQPVWRGTYYTLDAPVEALVCRRGSLVGVQHDTICRASGSGRIALVWINEDGMVVGLNLDTEVPIYTRDGFDEIPDLSAVEDMSLIGARSSAVIRRSTGEITLHPVSGDGLSTRVDFLTPIAPEGIAEDGLVTLGLTSREMLRTLVYSIDRQTGFRATLTLIDEAPEVFTYG